MIGTFYFNKSMHKINCVFVLIYPVFQLNCEMQYSFRDFRAVKVWFHKHNWYQFSNNADIFTEDQFCFCFNLSNF